MSNFGLYPVAAPQVLLPYTRTNDTKHFLFGGGGGENAWASANTMTAWYEMIASTAEDFAALDVMIGFYTSGYAGTALFEIGVGAAGSERVYVPAFQSMFGQTYVDGRLQFRVPIPIPKGTRIAARWQGSLAFPASERPQQYFVLTGVRNAPGLPICSRAAAPLSLSASSRGTLFSGIGYGIGAWQEMVASAPFDVRYMVYIENQIGGVTFEVNSSRDLAVGSAAAEVPIWQGQISDRWLGLPAISVAIPRGSRISRRIISNPDSHVSLLLFG